MGKCVSNNFLHKAPLFLIAPSDKKEETLFLFFYCIHRQSFCMEVTSSCSIKGAQPKEFLGGQGKEIEIWKESLSVCLPACSSLCPLFAFFKPPRPLQAA